MGGVFGFALISSYLERIHASDWVAILGLLSMVAFIVSILLLERRAYKRLVSKYGLACSNCGTEIAGVGHCWHCGAMVVQESARHNAG
jgi:hypothetical protein